MSYQGDGILKPHAFFFGKVAAVSSDAGAPRIVVDLGHRFGTGVIDKNGFSRLVAARVQWQQNPWSVAAAKDYTAFLEQLRQGDLVWVSVRGEDEDGQMLLDLEKFPQVNGGALVLKDGTIKAMTGGVENRFYNRAIYARRTMGSSFKPLVFAAALQLGWNSADLLQNSRDVFIFHNQPYFPRPDHHSPFDEVSMSWAGVKSENVASVWLVSRLCEKLTTEQFREVAEQVGLAPVRVDGEEERYSRFRSRIRDKNGIVINVDILRKAAYELALKNVETDFIFAGRDVEYELLRKMHYGLGFTAFDESIEGELKGAGLSQSVKEELLLRRKLLANNFLALEQVHTRFTDFMLRRNSELNYLASSSYPEIHEREYRDEGATTGIFYDEFAKRYRFLDDISAGGGMTPVTNRRLNHMLLDMDQIQRKNFWNDVYLKAGISVEAFELMQHQVNREMDYLRNQLPYSMDVLEHVGDFRILVGLRYLVALSRELGINSELKPVLSFPLGANVVTLLETLRVYEGLATGEVVLSTAPEVESRDLLTIINRIESAEGEILYQPQWIRKKLLAPETSVAIGNVLENVIKFGTGSYADKHIKLSDATGRDKEERFDDLGLSIPVLGKTGTANRYTNASFFGFLPVLSETGNSLSMRNGYAVGVYVGFDDNAEMKKGATRITGAAGALPIWCEIVNSIVRHERYADQLDAVDLTFSGLSLQHPEAGQSNFAVAPDRGGIIAGTAKIIDPRNRYTPSVLTFGTVNPDGSFLPARQFLPYWRISPLLEHTLSQ
jgi:cell division protein FtsI/penicillin-binding protein 2